MCCYIWPQDGNIAQNMLKDVQKTVHLATLLVNFLERKRGMTGGREKRDRRQKKQSLKGEKKTRIGQKLTLKWVAQEGGGGKKKADFFSKVLFLLPLKITLAMPLHIWAERCSIILGWATLYSSRTFWGAAHSVTKEEGSVAHDQKGRMGSTAKRA